MIELINQGVYLLNGTEIRTNAQGMPCADEARENTITYQILRQHDVDGAKGKNAHPLRRHDEPRHYLCRHYPNSARFRT